MRSLLLSFTLLVAAGDRTSDRDALLAADRSLSDRTAALGMLQGFLPTLTEGAAYLYPGAPLLRGTDRIRQSCCARTLHSPRYRCRAGRRTHSSRFQWWRRSRSGAACKYRKDARQLEPGSTASRPARCSNGGRWRRKLRRREISAARSAKPRSRASTTTAGRQLEVCCRRRKRSAGVLVLQRHHDPRTATGSEPRADFGHAHELERIDELRGDRLEEIDVALVAVVDVDVDLCHLGIGTAFTGQLHHLARPQPPRPQQLDDVERVPDVGARVLDLILCDQSAAALWLGLRLGC